MYLKEPSFKEAIKIFFWILSANLQGDISLAKPIIYDKPNFISLTLPTNLRFEVTKLCTTINNYDSTLKDAPVKLNPLLNTFLEQLEKAPGIIEFFSNFQPCSIRLEKKPPEVDKTPLRSK
jgi:hypothetical protein